MRAILVCVDYADLLAVTLPYNRHHFDEVTVVTSVFDDDSATVAEANGARVYRTGIFYDGGARFNKWAALEQGLDAMGREGWICIMDADILWPREIRVEPFGESLWLGSNRAQTIVHRGQLCTPLRRDMTDLPVPFTLPQEARWGDFPLHGNQGEWAGYTQIFHASDPVLGPPPWHQVDWKHAGGADSFFQAKWPRERKVRPSFEVLHLGPPGVNWMGRASKYLDGTVPEGAWERVAALGAAIRGRRGKVGDERFRHERLSP